jgi:4a-hydroxytetrahydrobiopterin dehydratase
MKYQPPPVTFASEDEIAEALASLPGWRRKGDRLTRELELRDFDEALSFVGALGHVAVDYLRRPDICITGFNNVILTIENEHHAGLTLAELRLAAKVHAFIESTLPDAGG